jgi:carbamoyl-phosphate synthase large subunit
VSEKKISELTRINPFFIKKLKKLYLRRKFIFSKINVYKMIDTCSSELEAFTPYFYSAHGLKNEAKSLTGPKVIILGSGPIKIGQGIEFDYLTVHAVKALKEKKVKSIVINNNPETVSTDFSISDRLYFEPLTPNFILKVVENEKEGLLGVIPQFGGQTAINLVEFLERSGVPILGTSKKSIDASEDREKTAEIITSLGYKMPTWLIVQNKIELLNKVKNLGYPVLIKPSFVLAGEGMVIAKNDSDVNSYLKIIGEQAFYKPVLVDKFLEKAMEIDVDFIADGQKTVAYILEQLEPAGIHSGDSRCVFPPQNITLSVQEKIKVMVEKISEAFGIIGIANLQCAVRNNEIFILEVNPRASRTVPFLSKCLGISLAKLATNVILGDKLPENLPGQNGIVAIKTPVFSFDKLPGVSKTLGPLMKSTGETMSIGKTYQEALRKIIDKEGFNDTNVYRLT